MYECNAQWHHNRAHEAKIARHMSHVLPHCILRHCSAEGTCVLLQQGTALAVAEVTPCSDSTTQRGMHEGLRQQHSQQQPIVLTNMSLVTGGSIPSSSPLYWKWMWSTMRSAGLATIRKKTVVPAAAGKRLQVPCMLVSLDRREQLALVCWLCVMQLCMHWENVTHWTERQQGDARA